MYLHCFGYYCNFSAQHRDAVFSNKLNMKIISCGCVLNNTLKVNIWHGIASNIFERDSSSQNQEYTVAYNNPQTLLWPVSWWNYCLPAVEYTAATFFIIDRKFLHEAAQSKNDFWKEASAKLVACSSTCRKCSRIFKLVTALQVVLSVSSVFELDV